MADASRLPPPSPEHRRIAAEQFERARQVLTSGSNRALARLLEKAGHFAEAIKLWELVRQAHPADVEAQHKAKDLAASETIARGHYQDAVAADAPVRAFQTAQKSSAEHKKLEVEAA